MGMKYVKATEAATLVNAGWDLTLTTKQWRRAAKRLHKWGITTEAGYKWYEVTTTSNISFT